MAAGLVGAEGLALLAVAVAEVLALSGSRLDLGLTTAVFFLVCGAGLGWAARGLWQRLSWARGPTVAAQMLVLGLAWSTRSVPWLALLLAAWALAVLVLVLRPAATESWSG